MTTPSEAHERRIEMERAHPIVDETMPGPPGMTFAITYYSATNQEFRTIEVESHYDARRVLDERAREHIRDDERIHNIVRVK